MHPLKKKNRHQPPEGGPQPKKRKNKVGPPPKNNTKKKKKGDSPTSEDRKRGAGWRPILYELGFRGPGGKRKSINSPIPPRPEKGKGQYNRLEEEKARTISLFIVKKEDGRKEGSYNETQGKRL